MQSVSFENKKIILGISCFYHDSAAALIVDGKIHSAAQEERFTRIKHDSNFPENAIIYCLNENNLSMEEVDLVIYYEKPLLTFERLLETYLGTAPRGLRSFIAAMQVWLKEKIFLKNNLKKSINKVHSKLRASKLRNKPKLLFSEHHLSHAASAFYPSPYEEAAILCMDGVGEWATTSAWKGKGNKIEPIWEISFPHSIGLLYSAFTYYCGFKVNSGEYKLMGLAPYGNPVFIDEIKNNLIDIKSDGTFRLDISYFLFHRGFRMTSRKFHKLFGQPPRKKEGEITQFHMDLAASIQVVTEEIVIKIAKSLRKDTKLKYLCLAGGVALNCVSNGKLLKEKIFDDIWIQPASGDAGTSIGAALLGWHQFLKNDRLISKNDAMNGSYLGPSFTNKYIESYLKKINADYSTYEEEEIYNHIADLLDKENVIGWFSGRMEFGPRALGARSIIGDPRNQKMQSIMNLKIKYRESFRPFAPSILEEEVDSYFDLGSKSPYMLLVAPLKENLRLKNSDEINNLFGIEKLNIPRSEVPAITHVDFSARVQTVNPKTNIRYYRLIKSFQEKTGCPLIINTSFNVRGEPIVCNPEDAFRCFMRTEMDILVLENQVLYKKDQKNIDKNFDWMQKFELD